MNVLVDGGLVVLRAGGNTDWIRSDLTTARIGTRGAVFNTLSSCSANVINTVNRSFEAANTHPDEVAQGVKIRSGDASKNAGFRFAVPQYWDGPTLIENGGVCELASTGAFPTGTDLTISGGGRLVVADASQTVASLTFGVGKVAGAINLNHTDFKAPPAIVAASGTHVVDADVTTDDDYYRSYETNENGGQSGAIGLVAQSNATLVVTGTMTMDPKRPVQVNPLVVGGGTTRFNGKLANGTGITVSSGTLEMDDLTELEGKTLTVKNGTFRFTGREGSTTAKLVTTPTVSTNASIICTDGDLVVFGQVDSTTGGFVKRGAGRLIFNCPGGVTNRIGHTFNRKDAGGNGVQTRADLNIYGGDVTFSAMYMGYELTAYDSHILSTVNMYDGIFKITGVFRFGQTYNKTGVNSPHATFNMYGGTYNHMDTAADTTGSRMGYLGSKADGEKTLNRACDATLNMFGGNYNEIERIHMGCNASTSHLNLHGGVLKAENIILDTSTSGNYCFFAGGSAYIFWNGGTIAPVGSTAANQTLMGLTEVIVSTNGAVVTTESLAGESYTIAQALLHDSDLEGADGGFVKKGAKPLALTGANTYTGDTVVEAGELTIPVGANASALPASSAVVVAEGATLSMASGTAARVGGLRFDMGTQYGALAGFAPATEGALYVTGVGETQRKGLVLPGTVTDAQHASNLTRWAVYVDGDLDDSLSAFVRNGTIVLDGKPGMCLIIR